MIERIIPIALTAMIVAVGFFIIISLIRRYRRDIGLAPEEQEKTPDVSFIINAFQDVTRQLKEKEKELERLKTLAERRAETVESHTENILQCVSNGVITFDEQGRIRSVNRAASEILDVDRDASIGKGCIDLFGKGDLCRTVQETFDNRTPSSRMETEVPRNGERLWLGFNTALLNDRQGKNLGVILSFSDLTDIKRLQEQMELKERLTALGEMSAGIAHELRNPMAVIAGYLNLLAKNQDNAGQGIIQDIHAEISGMNRIIGDLLTFARPTALNRVSVNFGELAETCIASVLQQGRSGKGITTEVRCKDLHVSADEGLLRQALCNLIQNAADAMPQGGSLVITAERRGKEAEITVSDTGAGIARERIKKIFLPFYTTRDTGVGMGLALVHKVITSHGGRIEVASEEGKGTTFTVTMPV